MLRPALAALLILTGCAATEPPDSFTAQSRMVGTIQLRTDLDFPPGKGPFGAVVLAHGCSGPTGTQSVANWRSVLRDAGFATLVLDSFPARGWSRSVCENAEQTGARGQEDRTADAYAALALLRTLPQIDPSRISLMGFSHGAGTALYVMNDPKPPARFHRLVANYPWCGFDNHLFQTTQRPQASPTLILIGSEDDYTPTSLCVTLAQRRAIQIRVYPGAHHSFDSGIPVRTVIGCGGIEGKCGVPVRAGHSDEAFKRAQEDVRAFLR